MPTNYEAQFKHGNPTMVDHTPSGAVTAGDVIVEAATPFIAHRDIAANELGAVASGGGVYLVDKASGSGMDKGDTVWWDNSNNRVTETATSNAHFGRVVQAALSAATEVLVEHDPQGVTGAIV